MKYADQVKFFNCEIDEEENDISHFFVLTQDEIDAYNAAMRVLNSNMGHTARLSALNQFVDAYFPYYLLNERYEELCKDVLDFEKCEFEERAAMFKGVDDS